MNKTNLYSSPEEIDRKNSLKCSTLSTDTCVCEQNKIIFEDNQDLVLVVNKDKVEEFNNLTKITIDFYVPDYEVSNSKKTVIDLVDTEEKELKNEETNDYTDLRKMNIKENLTNENENIANKNKKSKNEDFKFEQRIDEKNTYKNLDSINESSEEKIYYGYSQNIEEDRNLSKINEKSNAKEISNFSSDYHLPQDNINSFDETNTGYQPYSISSQQYHRDHRIEKNEILKISKKRNLKDQPIAKRKIKKVCKKRWNKHEDQLLIRLYNKYGKKWTLIAKHFKFRSKSRCFERYRLLNLDKNQKPWKMKEIYLLGLGSLAFKNSWASLEKYFPGRDNTTLKQKFYVLIKSCRNYTPVFNKLKEVHKNISEGKLIKLEYPGCSQEIFFLDRIAVNLYYWKLLYEKIKLRNDETLTNKIELTSSDLDLSKFLFSNISNGFDESSKDNQFENESFETELIRFLNPNKRLMMYSESDSINFEESDCKNYIRSIEQK